MEDYLVQQTRFRRGGARGGGSGRPSARIRPSACARLNWQLPFPRWGRQVRGTLQFSNAYSQRYTRSSAVPMINVRVFFSEFKIKDTWHTSLKQEVTSRIFPHPLEHRWSSPFHRLSSPCSGSGIEGLGRLRLKRLWKKEGGEGASL